MTLALRIGVIAEDANFASFLVPLIQVVCDRNDREARILRPVTTGGCQPETLRHTWHHLKGECGLVVVGADSGGQWHRGRSASFRKKARNLARLLGETEASPLLAVAEPSVEAWLMADPQAFRAGLERALSITFATPSHWPTPRSEAQAKECLARLVRDGTGDDLLRNGFEFADEIVPCMQHLESSASASLAEFTKSLARRLAGARRGGSGAEP